MPEYHVGNRVRIDIPDETNLNHDQYHGEHGQIVEILEDEADTRTVDQRDSIIYQIQLSDGEKIDVRHHAIRPPIE